MNSTTNKEMKYYNNEINTTIIKIATVTVYSTKVTNGTRKGVYKK